MNSPRTFARPSTSFIVGEKAPNPASILEGDAVLDATGSLRLTLTPSQDNGSVALDTSVEPPVLTLRGAVCRITPGYLDGKVFQVLPTVGSQMHEVTGAYAGLGSILNIVKR